MYIFHGTTSIYLLFAIWQNPSQGFEPCRPPERMTKRITFLRSINQLKSRAFGRVLCQFEPYKNNKRFSNACRRYVRTALKNFLTFSAKWTRRNNYIFSVILGFDKFHIQHHPFIVRPVSSVQVGQLLQTAGRRFRLNFSLRNQCKPCKLYHCNPYRIFYNQNK